MRLDRRLADSMAWPILVLGIASAVLAWWSRSSFWEDEGIAITHGLQPLPGFFVEVLRNDIHPFLYFLFLKLWSAPAFGSDRWVLASSLAGALASAAVIAWVTTKVHGRTAGLWAAALFCVLPGFTTAASNLRMYGIVPGLAIACWYANRQFLLSGTRRSWLAIVVLQSMLAYTHAIGFFFLPFLGLAALWQQWGAVRPNRRRLAAWAGVQALSVLAVVPLALSALARGTEPLGMPSLASLFSYPAQLIDWWSMPQGGVLVGAAVFVFLFALGAYRRDSRVTLLALPCGVLLTCMVVGSLGKPMFKPPVFVACLVPFLAMEAAGGLAGLRRGATHTCAVAGAMLLAVLLWAWPPAASSGNYQPAAAYVRANAQAGDVVIVPNLSVYWNVMRYAVGPHWGLPLEVMPLQSNASWTALKARLGPGLSERLGLNPRTDHVMSAGVPYVIGSSWAPAHARAWVVHRRNYKETVRVTAPMRVQDVQWFGDELSVSLLVADSAGTTAFPNPERP